MGHPPLLPLLLLLHTCVPASWGLRCMQCKTNGDCRVEECALGQDLCRTTIVRLWEEGEELELVEKSCTHSEKTNRTLSYRTGLKITSLTEVVCGLDLCNQGNSGRAVTYSRSRYLECISCGSSDMSCERGRHQSLQCRSPEEQCLDVVTHWIQEGEEEPKNQSYMVRGCATASMCQHAHLGDAFSMNHIDVSCCTKSGCNHPDLDVQYRSGAAPQPGPAHLSLTITLLMTARLWGGTLLWT
ncbi:urokinase plasminogen activator surface receptor isoform X11 [Homo sapiens]|uniref:urokinase plasminogen activator surface receptor isoform X11 n=1 Tax=Homo sapiens TaxID=9606 RepID=UPI0005CFFA51|nr:urokinase plasminogen activator surface receptor isoform X11 [Homo sapiens]XP_054177190.1 urokinase plasminogen activator surface receptor isoform X11 [Homo sapiens]|eukprot:XP_011525332.1 urokinase plasminogen activator surface receptor isoform X5 [Homo sapiens]